MANTRIRRCELCNVETDENNFLNHVQGKKHLKNVDAEKYRKGFLEKSIYVSRMPAGLTKDNVINFFSQFGFVEKCKVEPHFAIIEFRDKKPAEFLLSKPIWMGRNQLDIKRRRWNNPSPTNSKANDSEIVNNELNFAKLKTKLESVTTLEDEISTFMDTVQLKEDEVEKNWQSIHSSLVKALQPAFPNCEIKRFGSSITGLCLEGSDIDIYLNIGAQISDEKDNDDKDKDNSEKSRWTPTSIIKELKCHMYKNKWSFSRIVPIPKARTPIIKFCHTPTSTNCDISFKNGLGVINSELIKKLLSLDLRIKPLMIILKYWAKMSELSGCGKFTNYAIVMMIIFYLQQPETKILPAIEELQRTCKPIYNWNCQVNFDRDAKFPPSDNRSGIIELVSGFFEFYSNFPYDKQYISPLDGAAHPRSEVAKECAEEEPNAGGSSNKRPIYVQDPIELKNNITSSVTLKVLERFQSFSATGIEVCKMAMKSPEKPFLLELFTTLPAPVENRQTQAIVISAGKTLNAGLPEDFQQRIDIEDKTKFIENNWFTLTENLVEVALRRVFQLDVETMKNDREAKQQKVTQTSDVHFKGNDKIILKCISNYSVIAGRKSTSFCIDPTIGQIEKDALISEGIVKKLKEQGIKPENIQFMCTITRAKDPLRLILQLKNCNNSNKRFRSLASFLRTKLPKIVDKELIHIIQYNKRPNL